MKKITLFFIFLIQASTCFAWLDVDSSYYKYNVSTRLDNFGKSVLTSKSILNIVNSKKPLFEVNLSIQERYFDSTAMEFLGYDYSLGEYSGVVWCGLWFDGKTLIEGWAKNDKKIHVNYVYTIDPKILFMGNIRVGASTSVIEKFFNAHLYDISHEAGRVGHPDEDGDDWAMMGVNIEYDNGFIKSIFVFCDVVEDDVVPIVPSNEKIDKVKRQKEKELSTKLVKSTQPQYSTAEIVTYSLLCGALVSVLIVVLYMKLAVGADEVEPASNTLNPEADYIDAEIVDEAGTEDIDYPYEDIGTLFEETEG